MTPTRKDEQKVIAQFGKEMQAKLDVRDYKGRLGWREKNIGVLYAFLEDEMTELREAIFYKKDIKGEAVDVANSAMFIYDIIGRKKK